MQASKITLFTYDTHKWNSVFPTDDNLPGWVLTTVLPASSAAASHPSSGLYPAAAKYKHKRKCKQSHVFHTALISKCSEINCTQTEAERHDIDHHRETDHQEPMGWTQDCFGGFQGKCLPGRMEEEVENVREERPWEESAGAPVNTCTHSYTQTATDWLYY